MEQNSQNQVPFMPDNNMALAIFTTLCCCMPLGIYSIIRASKVKTYYAMEQYDLAQEAADDAKKFSYIGIGVGLIINILYVILNVFMASA